MNLAFLEGFLGECLQDEGRRRDALRFIRNAADSLAALAGENTLLLRVRSHWANARFVLGNLEAELGLYTEAERSAGTSIDLFEALAREVPSSAEFRNKAAYGYATLGKIHQKTGSHGLALAMLRKAAAILEKSDDAQDL